MPDETMLDPAEICSLAPEELTDRLAWIRKEILPYVLARSRLSDGLAIELRESPERVERVDDWLALERECCASISFERRTSRTPGRVRVEVRGIDPGSSLLAELGFGAETVAPQHPQGRLRRLAGAAFAGLGLSLFVCCVLPIAAAALLGAAAAPLASLDGPVPIATGALLGGIGSWLWLRRRHDRAARSEPAAAVGQCGPGC